MSEPSDVSAVLAKGLCQALPFGPSTLWRSPLYAAWLELRIRLFRNSFERIRDSLQGICNPYNGFLQDLFIRRHASNCIIQKTFQRASLEVHPRFIKRFFAQGGPRPRARPWRCLK